MVLFQARKKTWEELLEENNELRKNISWKWCIIGTVLFSIMFFLIGYITGGNCTP